MLALRPNGGMVSVLPVTRVCKLTFRFVCRFYTNYRICFLAHVPDPGVVFRTFSRIGPRVIVSIPLVVRGVVGGGILPGLRALGVGLLLGIPLVGSGVGRTMHRRVIRTFNKGFCRIVVKKTTFGRSMRELLEDLSFPCAMKCKVARYKPVVYCRS